MFCKNCGYLNWPYVGICKRCGKYLYAEFWKGIGLRELFIYIFLAVSFLFFSVMLKHLYSGGPIGTILVGVAVGGIVGIYFTVYLRLRIRGNLYLISKRTFYLPQLVIGILISLFFLFFPLFLRNLYDLITTPLIVGCWISMLILLIWLIRYERRNGRVLIE